MTSGRILLTSVGMNTSNVNDEIARNFYDMRESAFRNWKDKFYTDDINLYCLIYDPLSLGGVSNCVKELLRQSFGNFPITIDANVFCKEPEPRTNGGFWYLGCSVNNYVFDPNSLDKWHAEWNQCHVDCIEWEHKIFPFKSKNIEIMKNELEQISENSADYSLSEKKDLFRVQNNNYKDDDDVVNCFHNLIMKHKSDVERIAYAKELGDKICLCNGYHREQGLERLEKDHDGNDHAERIYSIKNKNGEYIFLCIDKMHGMLEWCDDKGDHQGELRFDGSKNGNKTKEPDHGLRCVAEWKRLYDR